MDAETSSETVSEKNFTQKKFNFNATPLKRTGAWADFNVEGVKNNFLKGCKWAPDGLCVLTASDDNCLRLFNMPHLHLESEPEDGKEDEEMRSVLKMKESDTIYDYDWYPLMNSTDSSTCCLASSSRHNPVHLWDAYSGRILATYKAFSHVDEVVSAVSVAFHPLGNHVYCGFENMIRVFDVNYPGRNCTEHVLKGKGHTGIISTIAFSKCSEVFAAGSYLRTIGVYGEQDGTQLFLLNGQVGGVTQLMFSADGNQLYSGGRKDDEILCWDIRSPGKVLYSLMREVHTNQRIYFDIDSSGTYVISGSSIGNLYVWDTSRAPLEKDGVQVLETIQSFQAHQDCVNGVSFNPCYPVFTSTSGQRKFLNPVESDEEEDEVLSSRHITYDNSMMLWLAM